MDLTDSYVRDPYGIWCTMVSVSRARQVSSPSVVTHGYCTRDAASGCRIPHRESEWAFCWMACRKSRWCRSRCLGRDTWADPPNPSRQHTHERGSPANAVPGSNLSIEVPVEPVSPQPAVVPGIPAAAVSPPVATGRIGDRRTVQDGATALCQPNAITLSSWEVKDARLCEKICLALRCSVADTSRAYIYIRDNRSLELNDTSSFCSCCTCCCPFQDSIRVEYFDRPPWTTTCTLAPFPWCCCVTCVSAAPPPLTHTLLTPVRAGKSVHTRTTDVPPLRLACPRRASQNWRLWISAVCAAA